MAEKDSENFLYLQKKPAYEKISSLNRLITDFFICIHRL